MQIAANIASTGQDAAVGAASATVGAAAATAEAAANVGSAAVNAVGGAAKAVFAYFDNQVEAEIVYPPEDRNKTRFVFVFVLGTKPNYPFGPWKTEDQIKAFREDLLKAITHGGLQYELFYSTQLDEIYVKVKATDARLLLEADGDEPYYLELDSKAMETVAISDKDKVRPPIRLKPPFDHKYRFESRAWLPGHEFGVHDKQEHPGWYPMTDDQIMAMMRSRTTLDPFVHLYAPYVAIWENHHKHVNDVQIYKRCRDGTILRMVDRIRLATQVMERTSVVNPLAGSAGCGLNIDKMLFEKRILAAFPYNSLAEARETHERGIDELFSTWVGIFKLPWVQPLDDVRNFFGEKVAVYYAFVGHYTKWVFWASIVGFAIFLHQLGSLDENTGAADFLKPSKIVYNLTTGQDGIVVYTEVPELAFYSLFVMVWGSVMFEYWKRKQIRHAMEWGQTKHATTELPRPEFVPSYYIPDPVTGLSISYYSPFTLYSKLTVAGVVVACAVVAVIGTVASIMVLKVFMSLDASKTGLSQSDATLVGLVFNAVAIQVLAIVYKNVANVLTEWENHRIESAFENSLIIKSFVFSFANAYAVLAYIAFLKRGEVILGQAQYCDPTVVQNVSGVEKQLAPDQCFGNLGYSLLIIQVVQIVKNNLAEVVIPSLMASYIRRSNLAEHDQLEAKMTVMDKVKRFAHRVGLLKTAPTLPTLTEEELKEKNRLRLLSFAEEQYFLPRYPGPFHDYLELLLQFGYATLFVAAFPLAPFLAGGAIQVAMRTKAFKLCKLLRRPTPSGCNSIGAWQPMFYIMSYASVLTNAGVIFFTADVIGVPAGVNISGDAFKVWMWIVSCAAVLSLKALLVPLIPDVPEEVDLQLKRQDYLIERCFKFAVPPDTEGLDGWGIMAAAAKPGASNANIFEIDPDQRKAVSAILGDAARAKGKEAFEEELNKLKSRDREEVTQKQLADVLLSIPEVKNNYGQLEIEFTASSLDWNGNGHIYVRDIFALTDEALKGA